MIGKILPADSVYHTLRYIMHKPEAQVLASEGLREHDYRLTARDFETQRTLRPEKQKACFHAVLSFAPGENIPDERMREIAGAYLQRLGFVNTQYIIVRHNDREHQHMHLIANKVGRDGGVISDRFIALRGKQIAQELTKAYGLEEARRKQLSRTNLEELNRKEAVKYAIYKCLVREIPESRAMVDLVGRLAKYGIEVRLKRKGNTEEVQGISFRKDGLSFKGSEIDRNFSYAKLQKVLAQQVKEQRLGERKGETWMRSKPEKALPSWSEIRKDIFLSPEAFREKEHQELDRKMERIIELILAPEEQSKALNQELLREAKRKKKQRGDGGLEM